MDPLQTRYSVSNGVEELLSQSGSYGLQQVYPQHMDERHKAHETHHLASASTCGERASHL